MFASTKIAVYQIAPHPEQPACAEEWPPTSTCADNVNDDDCLLVPGSCRFPVADYVEVNWTYPVDPSGGPIVYDGQVYESPYDGYTFEIEADGEVGDMLDYLRALFDKYY